MKYFDKELLDNRTIERIEEQLEAYQTVVWDYSVLKEYRDFYSEIMGELLDYYNDRMEKEPEYTQKLIDSMPDDLPF